MSNEQRNITPVTGLVAPVDRERLLGQRGAVVWLTGLSGSGKSTIAYAVEKELAAGGHACYVLDGDNLRHGLNRDLGFSPQDRSENIRRVAEVARLFNEAGLIVVTAFISPYLQDRQRAREIIGVDRFVEVFVDVPLPVCEARDVRGLYKKARAGLIAEFTGVSAPYEPPPLPQLHLHADSMTVPQTVQQVLDHLRSRGAVQ